MKNIEYTKINSLGLPNIVIPAEILFNEKLSSTEKILFGFLNNLTSNEQGYCWASNKYLSKLINIRPETISSMINKLYKLEYLYIEYEIRYDGAQIRKIYINPTYPQKYQKILQKVLEKTLTTLKDLSKGGLSETLIPIKDNLKEGLSETLKGGLSKTLNNIDNNKLDNKELDIKNIDTKVSYVPTERYSSDVQKILNFWNNLTGTTKHKDSTTKVYKRIYTMIENLMNGRPVICNKNNMPAKSLENFCKKYNIPDELLFKTWSISEIKRVLYTIVKNENQRLSLDSTLWNNFAKGGGFSYFLFEANKKQLPKKYLEMAETLSKAIKITLPPNKRLDWAKEFQILSEENGRSEQEINEILEWYVKNYDYSKVKSVMDAKEFREYYMRIRKSMQIQKEQINIQVRGSNRTGIFGICEGADEIALQYQEEQERKYKNKEKEKED